MMEVEILAYTELMTIASTRGGQPYKPLVQGEIRVFLIHVVGLSPKEVENNISPRTLYNSLIV